MQFHGMDDSLGSPGFTNERSLFVFLPAFRLVLFVVVLATQFHKHCTSVSLENRIGCMIVHGLDDCFNTLCLHNASLVVVVAIVVVAIVVIVVVGGGIAKKQMA